jgi:hypothetical protein
MYEQDLGAFMVLKTEDLFDKAIALSKNVDDTFLELGRTLRQLQDRESRLFQEIVAKSDLGAGKRITWSTSPASSSRCK